MDFSRFEDSIKAEQAKFNEIKNVKDAAKYDEICSGLNKTLADISLVASYVPTESKKGLISILRAMRDFAMELVGYKKSFDYVEEEPVVEEVVSEAPVQEQPVPAEPMNVAPVQEDPIDITIDEAPSEQSPSESQSMSLNNAKTLALTNPNVPKHSNPFVPPAAA